MNDVVECPYCGYENDMSDGCVDLPSDNTFTHTCENEKCEKEFEVYVEFEPNYSACKIELVNCDRCKKEIKNKDAYNKESWSIFSLNLSENTLCKECLISSLNTEERW